MSRKKIILLNKANEVLKILSNSYTTFNVKIESYNVYITIPGVTILYWELGEKLIDTLKKINACWNLKVENNNMVINIWTQN